METNSAVNNKSNMRMQVAQSKGTEWMVSNYNEWQQRSPLPYMPEPNSLSLGRLVNRMAQKGNQLNGVLSLSFGTVLSIILLLLSAKNR